MYCYKTSLFIFVRCLKVYVCFENVTYELFTLLGRIQKLKYLLTTKFFYLYDFIVIIYKQIQIKMRLDFIFKKTTFIEN